MRKMKHRKVSNLSKLQEFISRWQNQDMNLFSYNLYSLLHMNKSLPEKWSEEEQGKGKKLHWMGQYKKYNMAREEITREEIGELWARSQKILCSILRIL